MVTTVGFQIKGVWLGYLTDSAVKMLIVFTVRCG